MVDLFLKFELPGQAPPNDRLIQIKRDQRISILTYTIMASISGIGIFLAIGFFVFNIIFRDHRWDKLHLRTIRWLPSFRFIRMSSPQINNLIIAGCILSYTSVLLMGIDSTLLGKRSSKSAMNFICAVRSIVSFLFFCHGRCSRLLILAGKNMDIINWFYHFIRSDIQ